MPRSGSPRQFGLVAAALAVAGVCLGGCSSPINPVGGGSGSPAPASSSPSSSPSSSSSSSSAAGPLAPLTGLPAASEAAADKPAVALDLTGSDPSGLTSADLVFQEFSAPVRYIAVFQSKQATAGPVTGTQPADKQALSVLHPLIGYDGAAAPFFITSLDKSKLKDAGYGAHPSLYTAGTQGLTTSTQAIISAVTGETAPPQVFRYRGSSSGANTLAATGVSRPTSARVSIPGNATQDWTFSQKHNAWELTSGGPPVRVANVVVQTVPYKTIGINKRAGISAQVAQVLGRGHAEVLSGSAAGGSGGTAASGTWAKTHIRDVTNYLENSGSPMAFQPGSTWIILAPPGTTVSTSG
jgi:Protein of unknown function (DUF3048) C-terminal domain